MLLNDRDQIIAMTAEWTGERYPNGRPRVSDEKIEILKNLTQEEIWQPLYSCGYRFQFQGDLKPLHPDKKLYGRAVTCCFMPQRPDLRQHVFNVARSRGWKGDCNQWVIDSLEESDVVVWFFNIKEKIERLVALSLFKDIKTCLIHRVCSMLILPSLCFPTFAHQLHGSNAT